MHVLLLSVHSVHPHSLIQMCLLQVNATRAVVHSEEQEEGDMRPDLDTELHVSRVNVC